MNLKKIIGLLLFAFVIFYVLTFPAQASSLIKSTFTALGDLASNLATFVTSLV